MCQIIIKTKEKIKKTSKETRNKIFFRQIQIEVKKLQTKLTE